MKRFMFVAFSGLLLSFKGQAQDFTYKELLQLRNYTLDSFESYVTNKDYEFFDVHDERGCATFRKSRNSISYCQEKADGNRGATEVTVRYELDNREQFNVLKRQIKENDEDKNLTHNFSNDLIMTHVFVDDQTSVHLYTNFSSHKIRYDVEVLPTVTDRYLHRGDRF